MQPIAFNSRKVKTCCKDPLCSTTERILLSIVEVLKKFRSILLDLKRSETTSVPQGENNVVADALSRLDMGKNPTT